MRFQEVTYRGRVKVGLYGSPYNYAEITWIGDPSAEPPWISEKGRQYSLGPRSKLVKKGGQVYTEEVKGSELGFFKGVLRGLGLNEGPVTRIWNDMRRKDEAFAESERQRYREQHSNE